MWGYARPEELPDPGLRDVWKYLRDYLTVPAPHPKPLADLVSLLSAPPYGVRAGIIPILFAAALRAFPGPISITRGDGAYVSDLLPSTIEAMAAHPNDYQVLVPHLTADQRQFLDRVATLFGSADDSMVEADPVRRCHDSLAQWRSSLPHSALISRHLSPRGRSFGRLMSTAIDPYRLLFEAVPAALGVRGVDADGILRALHDCKAEVENIVQWNYESAARAIRSAFPAVNGKRATLQQVVRAWAQFFPGSVVQEVLRFLPSPQARWCTRKLKIEPFERYVGSATAFSYIGIRADEDRQGYTPKKPPVFSDRPNIVPVYPFKDDGVGLSGVKELLETSGIGLPDYYSWRSRSGCYFCFYQQIGEWQRLRAEHPTLFEQAKGYEQSGGSRHYTWVQGRPLARIEALREQHRIQTVDEAEGCATCHL